MVFVQIEYTNQGEDACRQGCEGDLDCGLVSRCIIYGGSMCNMICDEDKRKDVGPRIVRSGVIMKQQAADLTRRPDDEASGNSIEMRTLNLGIRHGDVAGVLYELP